MFGCLIALALMVFAGAPAYAAAQAQERPIVYSVPGMDRVQVRKNVTYKTAGSVDLKMDIYSPPDLRREARLPAVIFLSGGVGLRVEPRPKDWPAYVSWGRLIAASGMIGVTFTYRLAYPRRQYQEGASDLMDLIAHLRSNAESLNIDGDRLCLIAFSGGGPMLSVPLRDRPDYIRCIIGFYTFMDTSHVDPAQAGTSQQVIDAFSPVSHLMKSSRKAPPMLIARAGRDQIQAVNRSIDNFVKVAIEQNLMLDFINHPDGEHGFDAQNDTARTREIIARAIAFMKTHLQVD
ncbi:MAG: alpha/beta hydrolase [Blastocatellia bacterium]|nr:alpha/beta hydrolase [Blastocatellia bacterium]